MLLEAVFLSTVVMVGLRTRLSSPELLSDPFDEEATGGHRPERAGSVGERVAGLGAQFDIGGDVEFELFNAGCAGNRDHIRQADQPGQRDLRRLGADLGRDVAQRLQQRLHTPQVLGAEQLVRRPHAAGSSRLRIPGMITESGTPGLG